MNRNHYTIRLTEQNDTDRAALMISTGDNSNSVINHTLRIGFLALTQNWDAVKLKHAIQQAHSAMAYNGNAAKFRTTLLGTRTPQAPHAKTPLHK